MFCGADQFNNIANKFLDMDKSCHTHFSGTGKIFVMNCCRFQILFISCIHLVTQSSYFVLGLKLVELYTKGSNA